MMSLSPDRVTDLGVFSGGQLLLLVVGLIGIGVLIGQRWPSGRVAMPHYPWGMAVRVSGWLCLSAPSFGLFYLYRGGSMLPDHAVGLLFVFLFGVFQYWMSVPREVEDDGEVRGSRD